MAPSDVRPDKEEPIQWGRMIADMFRFKFEPKRETKTRHARVWKCVGTVSDFRKASEEPVGIITWEEPIGNPKWTLTDILWTKIDGKWMSSDSSAICFIRAYPITEAEHGTDIAFGLWPELRCTSRPFRVWCKRNNHLLKKWSVLIATLSLGGVSYAASQADGAINNWFIVAMCMGVVAFIACSVFLVTNDFEW